MKHCMKPFLLVENKIFWSSFFITFKCSLWDASFKVISNLMIVWEHFLSVERLNNLTYCWDEEAKFHKDVEWSTSPWNTWKCKGNSIDCMHIKASWNLVLKPWWDEGGFHEHWWCLSIVKKHHFLQVPTLMIRCILLRTLKACVSWCCTQQMLEHNSISSSILP